jgi:hypothetical protein
MIEYRIEDTDRQTGCTEISDWTETGLNLQIQSGKIRPTRMKWGNVIRFKKNIKITVTPTQPVL